ncbi:MAG TPA: N-methyl-D-aspartate receptor NMDAR2C subunit [Verrucomicrobiae bacterium]|jgi:predicted metal-dependent HD superfamily phosphohydrolase|nr:N-methyl-D-aspartate receptor NMDAR2C subunit [Verrucomicrobiae bacterium]
MDFSRLSLEAWSALWSRLGARNDASPLHAAVLTRYGEAHRAYHTAEHIARILPLLDGVRARLREPDEAELALWLHDLVYDPRGADNEARSAAIAAEWLAAGGAPAARSERVRALIMATRHAAPPEEHDARYVVDADLSILGAPPAAFDRYETQVRREYAFVPEAEWRTRRAALLRRFLAQPRLFLTEEFGRFEAPARANLARSCARLEG